MEGLLVAVRDIATGRPGTPTGARAQQVEALIHSMAAAGEAAVAVGDAGGLGGRAAGGGGGKIVAAKAARDFAAMTTALEEDSGRLKTELAAARAALAQKLAV